MPPENTNDPTTETRRLVIGALLVAGIVLALHFTPLNRWLVQAQDLKSRIDDYGWKAHALFLFGSVVAIALGAPRLVLCGLGGVLFGFLEGLLLAQFSGVLGSYGAFLITRLWGPREWVRQRLRGAQRLRPLLENPSIGSIFVVRQLPVPGIVANVLLGVLSTRHRMFLLGTFLGYLPSNIPVALAGSSMAKESLGKAIAQVSLSMLALGAGSALIMTVRGRLRSGGGR
ncbi:MAG: VTT domain-containing protein [Verrucomicrobiales bacterium]|nr:VTT domain-containing protein [Verrucomicrobiales bacterium]